jgi:phosphatidylglycerophosphate synthase
MRQLKKFNITREIDNVNTLNPNDRLLLIRADYLYDDRLLQELVNKCRSGALLSIGKGGKCLPVAACVAASMSNQAREVLQGNAGQETLSDIHIITPKDLSLSGFQKSLRKLDQPFVLPINSKNQKILEDHLFYSSYKGITDLVTKWIWPIPAKRAVHFCVNHKISPNQVTSFGLILVITVTFLFYFGFFVTGLILGWFMTFLDTVDGKLARVTVTSSKFGNILDHGIDLLHPPVWYAAWGLGIPFETEGFGLTLILWLIVTGYIAGRLIEGLFQKLVGRFSIFCWRPFDSYFRLITARRNPNMLILTTSIIFNKPLYGLIGVALWTLFTSTVLFLRLCQAIAVKRKYGSPSSWLQTIDSYKDKAPLAIKIFTNSSSAELMERFY